METADSAKWTTDDIRTLLDSMKESIEKPEGNKVWNVGLKTLDWNKVAFDDFTAEECNAKWQEIMQKLRKIKTITELIVDAQNAIDNTPTNTKMEFPKKPVSANALFFAKNKEILKKIMPGMNSRELMKFANESYKKLPPVKKEKYIQKVQEAKAEYQENIKKLQIPFLEERETGKRESKGTHTAKKECTKLPGNGYNLFCREQKSLLTGIPRKEITAVWSRRWKELPKEEKNKYSWRCTEMKNEAQRKKKDITVNEFDKKKRKQTKKFPGEPKMPTRSICGLYLKNEMKKMKGEVKGSRSRFGTASQRSKVISQQEKEKYQAIINRNFSTYKEQLRRWFETLTPTQQQKYCERNPNKMKYLRIKRQSSIPLHRTSDSEDEDLEDSSTSDTDVDIIELATEDEEEEKPMFDLF